MSEYDDIISHSYEGPKTRPRMSMLQRAAQFSAFAALRGFDEEIAETARYTEAERTLTAEKVGEIAEKIALLGKRGGAAEVLYFVPDEKKTGGEYLTKRGKVKKAADGNLIFSDGTRIPFDLITDLELL